MAAWTKADSLFLTHQNNAPFSAQQPLILRKLDRRVVLYSFQLITTGIYRFFIHLLGYNKRLEKTYF